MSRAILTLVFALGAIYALESVTGNRTISLLVAGSILLPIMLLSIIVAIGPSLPLGGLGRLMGSAGTPIQGQVHYYATVFYNPAKNDCSIEENLEVGDDLAESIIWDSIRYGKLDLGLLPISRHIVDIPESIAADLQNGTVDPHTLPDDSYTFPGSVKQLLDNHGVLLSHKAYLFEDPKYNAPAYIIDLVRKRAFIISRNVTGFLVDEIAYPEFCSVKDFLEACTYGWRFVQRNARGLIFERGHRVAARKTKKTFAYSIVSFPVGLPQFEQFEDEKLTGYEGFYNTGIELIPDEKSVMRIIAPKGVIANTFPSGPKEDRIETPDEVHTIKVGRGFAYDMDRKAAGKIWARVTNPLFRNPMVKWLLPASFWGPIQWLIVLVCGLFFNEIKTIVLQPMVKQAFWFLTGLAGN